MAFQHCFNRIHPLGAIRWMFSDGGPVKVVVDDFFWNNRGRINHHELGGIPLYWVKPVDKKDRKKGSWLWGHAHYGDEIYATRQQAYGHIYHQSSKQF